MASGKVTNILVQKYDQLNTQESVQINPFKLPSRFPDIHPGMVYCKIILMRIDDDIDAHLSKQQFGFRKKRGTVDAIFIVRQIMEKANEHQVLLHLICVDSKAALYTNWKYVEAYCGGSQDCISD